MPDFPVRRQVNGQVQPDLASFALATGVDRNQLPRNRRALPAWLSACAVMAAASNTVTMKTLRQARCTILLMTAPSRQADHTMPIPYAFNVRKK
jgi:hypothetical protein